MLFLQFQLGTDRYALETSQIVEILPLVHWKTLPQAPAGVAGVFNYHGSPVPLIDLGELALGKPSHILMSTRIILVKYATEAVGSHGLAEANKTHLLGLLAEHATSVLRRSGAEFVEPGVSIETAPYLGPISTDAQGIIQQVAVRHLLPASVRDLLFRQTPETI